MTRAGTFFRIRTGVIYIKMTLGGIRIILILKQREFITKISNLLIVLQIYNELHVSRENRRK